jgi:hypothetical protein
MDEMNQSMQKLSESNEAIGVQIEKMRVGRESGAARDALMDTLAQVTSENTELKEELEKFREMDPDAFEKQSKYNNCAHSSNSYTRVPY